MTGATVDVRRSGARFRTTEALRDSRHSFSFGPHYEPGNTHFGVLLAHNVDVLAPGGGFDTHPHRDIEILTWVLEGALAHRDSTGHHGVVRPGVVARLSAGSGVRHSEHQAGPGRAHVVQMWIAPDTDGPPDHARLDLGPRLEPGALVVVASGLARHAGSALTIRQPCAALHAARLRPGTTATLPTAPHAHLFVACGSVHLHGVGVVDAGDAARITTGGPPPAHDGTRVTAGAAGAEILVWEMHATLG